MAKLGQRGEAGGLDSSLAEDGGGLARRKIDDGSLGYGEGTDLRLLVCEYLAIYATRNIRPPRVPESETLSAVTLPWTGGNDRRSLGNRHIHAMGRFTRWAASPEG